MNKRVLDIIDEFILPKGKMTLEALSKRHDVSERSIRNYLAEIEIIITKIKKEKIYLLARDGKIKIPENLDFAQLREKVSEDYYFYRLSVKERRIIATVLFINSSGFVTLQTIADYLCVSRVTIINDLKFIRTYLKSKNLKLSSRSHRGFFVEGTEYQKRIFLSQQVNIPRLFIENNIVEKCEDYSRILRKIVNEQEHLHTLILSDDSFAQTIRYLNICIIRCQHGFFLKSQIDTEGEFFYFAQDIIKYIVQYCHVSLSKVEIYALDYFFSTQRFSHGYKSNNNMVQLQLITRQFIESIAGELSPALKSDFEFFDNLSTHLSQTLFQKEINFAPPVIKEVSSKYPKIAKVAKRFSNLFESYAGRLLTQNELDYIIIHICAALERAKNNRFVFRVIVACHAGIGTSKLLLEKLRKHFNFNIVNIIAAHDMKSISNMSADLVISTVPLDDCPIPYIVVSPMISDEDYVRLGEKVDMIRASNRFPILEPISNINAETIMEVISPIAKEILLPDQYKPLLRRVHRAVRQCFQNNGRNSIFLPQLHHLLSPTHIRVDVKVNNWKEAIIEGSSLLLSDSSIKQSYVSEMIKTVELFGPYIVMAPGFALPHAAPEAGSLKLAMQFTKLRTPVFFGNKNFDPVYIICTLSTIDENTHLKAMFNMISLIKQKDFRLEIMNAESSKQIADIILKYEYMIES